jgi:hypothetical protein
MAKKKITARLPEKNRQTDDDIDDQEDENFFLDWTPGSEERDQFIAHLQLTHTNEEVQKIIQALDRHIEGTRSMLEEQNGQV